MFPHSLVMNVIEIHFYWGKVRLMVCLKVLSNLEQCFFLWSLWGPVTMCLNNKCIVSIKDAAHFRKLCFLRNKGEMRLVLI